MAGFRPGKVPLKLVEQTYGPQVRSEVIGDAVQKSFSDAVRDQNLRVAGYPRIERNDGAPDGELRFSATFEVYPEIAPGELAGVAIERPTLAVGEAEVDKTIEVLRKQRIRYEPADRPAASGDRVTVDFVGTIDGAEFAGGKGADHAFVLGEGRMLRDFEAGVTGLAAGESKTVPVHFPADYQAKELAGKAASFVIDGKEGRGGEAPRRRRRLRPLARRRRRRPREDARGGQGQRGARGEEAPGRRAEGEGDAGAARDHQARPAEVAGRHGSRAAGRGARADLQARGLKMENVPIDPQLFEDQAKRRVALGLIVAEVVQAVRPRGEAGTGEKARRGARRQL